MKLELAESISELVKSKYFSAKSSGSLVFSPTELTIIRSRSGLPVISRCNPTIVLFHLMSSPVPTSVLSCSFEEAGS
jgi:hypothetical protein